MKNILLLHGWGYNSYSNMAKHSSPWYNKREFIDQLKKHFNIYTPFFPGFCGQSEPKTAYDLDDYAKYIENYIKVNNLKIDFILGNSFGGAVAIRYKSLLNPRIPIILIVPAILRKAFNSKKFINTPKLFDPIRNGLRDLYLIYYKKTPEMRYGTRFLQNSYQNIVRYNLMLETNMFQKGDVLILLGSHDNMVDTNKIYRELSPKFDGNICKIDGGHEIIETHIDEVLSKILKFAYNSQH